MIINIEIRDVAPSVADILRLQEIPESRSSDQRTSDLAAKAISIFKEVANPRGIISDISCDEFADIFTGQGNNEPDAPLGAISPESDHLTLFALTMGGDISNEISGLFARAEFALGTMLDSAASAGAELGADHLENMVRIKLSKDGKIDPAMGIMRFSPGYCGWHISAQKKLFDFFKPQDIGIRVRDSFLMEPLKSISGAIVAGRKEIFEFEDNFSFCLDCKTHSCLERFRTMMATR